MISFAAVLFFTVTGLTLNHPDWFGDNCEISRTSVAGTGLFLAIYWGWVVLQA